MAGTKNCNNCEDRHNRLDGYRDLQVDTKNVLFIVGGAFAGLEKIIQQRSETTGIGFSAEIRSSGNKADTGKLLGQVQPEDLIKFGLIPEFVGRLPVVATLEELDEEAYFLLEDNDELSNT